MICRKCGGVINPQDNYYEIHAKKVLKSLQNNEGKSLDVLLACLCSKCFRMIFSTLGMSL